MTASISKVYFRERDEASDAALLFSAKVSENVSESEITAFAGFVITESGEVHISVSPGEDFARLLGAIEMLKEDLHESVRENGSTS